MLHSITRVAFIVALVDCLALDALAQPQQWGDLVRNANPGYSGSYPRVSIWYGTSDTTVRPVNATVSRDQWTNVWHISQTPSRNLTLAGGATVDQYDAAGSPAVSVYAVPGIGHGTPVDPGSAINQCGSTGQYYPDSICSTYQIATSWGLDSGVPPPSGLPAPTGLTVTGTSNTTASLSWSAVNGAAGYHVYRDGARITAAPITSTSYADSGLSAATTYEYAVSAADADGIAGSRSATVSATTTGAAPVCVTASNYQHTVDGRAHVLLGLTYANGSNQAMGLWNVLVVHTLKQTGSNYWVIADDQC